ncbi:MAG: Nickel and cobalt resistance protein CnrB [Candidatus Dichloromethanomonas elyunquensis]|nr:MAG: Nickel and cobalt resistance protein CnrB [Candidatus Dichloromethanomonas elyunquensis]
MKKGTKTVLVALSCLFFLAGCSTNQNSINITAAQVKTDNVISDTTYSGSTEASETRNVFSNISGKVAKVNVSVGDQVKAGDVLFTLDDIDAQLQARQAQLNAEPSAITPAQVAYDEAAKNYERTKSLFDAGAVSQIDLDAAKAKKDTTEAQLETAKRSAQITLDMANKKLSDTVIKAPISGIVSAKTVQEGDTVSTQVPAMTMINPSQVQVVIHVTEKNAGQVYSDMPAQITIGSNGETFQGKVTMIAPAGDPKTGLFDVKVIMDNAQNKVKPGMLANVTLQGAKEPSVLLVPKQAIVTEDQTSYVYIVSEEKLKKCPVQTGKVRNAYIEITSGLTKNDVVVVQGSDKISEDSKFTVVSVLF